MNLARSAQTLPIKVHRPSMEWVCERLGEASEKPVRGLIVVPHNESAAWWRLTKHMKVVGRLPAGGRHLEANVLGVWRPAVARRDALVLAFPRSEAEAMQRGELRKVAAALQESAPDEPDAAHQWRAARASAEEAAAARRHVQPVDGKAGQRQRPPVWNQWEQVGE